MDGIGRNRRYLGICIGSYECTLQAERIQVQGRNGSADKVLRELPKLMNLLEEIRTACGNRAITVTSGYRTESYNKKVDGAKQSQHLYAAAADIKVSGKSASEVYKLCDRLVGSRGGVGKYSTFTHVDVRGHKARW